MTRDLTRDSGSVTLPTALFQAVNTVWSNADHVSLAYDLDHAN
jgi:hypothetical protein